MPHFIINSAIVNAGKIVVADKELYKHIARVLRAKQGEKVIFIDENEIQYVAEVENITSDKIYTKVVDSYKSERKLYIELYLAQSVLKTDAQFSILQKATELGVKGIIPLYTDNCTLKENFIKSKIDKWQKIVFESVKQCERADIPKVFSLSNLDEIRLNKKFDIIVAFVERDAECSLKEYFKTIDVKNKTILAIIGPEGGFSDREFDFFERHNIKKITLGNLIYRADTAAVVALSNLIYEVSNS